MTEQLPSGAFLSFILLDPDIRDEMERLIRKGISGETIAQAISERYHCSVEYVPLNRDIHPFTRDYIVEETVHVAVQPYALTKAYMEKYPWRDAVEGSIVEAIQDEGRLID